MYLSNFGISTYNSCPNKFKLKYIDKVTRNIEITSKYFSFDKSIHAAMKVINTLPIEELKIKNNLLSILEDTWLSSGYESKSEETTFKYRAFKMIESYLQHPKDVGLDNLILSSTLSMNLTKDLIITSRVDKVYERFDSGIEIVDYKTGSSINEPLNFNSNVRLPIYLLLVHQKLNIYPKAISYYYLKYNKKFTYFITKTNIEKASVLVENIFTKIRGEKVFKCTPTPYCKDYCECYSSCKSQHLQNF